MIAKIKLYCLHLKVEGYQNNWQWAAAGPREQAWTVVEKENIFRK